MSLAPLRSTDHLVMAAARLARSSPVSWEEFLKALSVVSTERAAACVQAPSDQVVITQGMARQIAELHTLFTGAVAQATRLEDKLKEKQHGR